VIINIKVTSKEAGKYNYKKLVFSNNHKKRKYKEQKEIRNKG
jgi:hypothetical protein